MTDNRILLILGMGAGLYFLAKRPQAVAMAAAPPLVNRAQSPQVQMPVVDGAYPAGLGPEAAELVIGQPNATESLSSQSSALRGF